MQTVNKNLTLPALALACAALALGACSKKEEVPAPSVTVNTTVNAPAADAAPAASAAETHGEIPAADKVDNTHEVEAAAANAQVSDAQKDQYNKDEAEMADNAPWMDMTAKDGSKISVRFYQAKEEGMMKDWADLKMDGKTLKLSKAMEETNGKGGMVYGDGDKTTLISRNGGGTVIINQGKGEKVYE